MAATPNPAANQRNREYLWTILPPGGRTGTPPQLVGHFDPRAHDLWARWWATPMATMWGEFDSDALERLLGLYQSTWTPIYDDDGNEKSTPASVLSEIRQMEDRYGLTPAGRRKLYWKVEGVDTLHVDEKVMPAESGKRSAPAAGGKNDPRVLHAIDGGKKQVG